MSLDGWIALVLLGPAGLVGLFLLACEAWAEFTLWLEFRAASPARARRDEPADVQTLGDGSQPSPVVVDAPVGDDVAEAGR